MKQVDAAISGLRSTPGLRSVADQLQDMIDEKREQPLLVRRGAKGELVSPRHLLMVGPPGTGKSMTTDVIAQAYQQMGITSSEKGPVKLNARLLGTSVGEAENNMLDAISQAEGGVLLVDEAHQLKESPYGVRAVKALLSTMADPKSKTVVIFAGYPKEIRELLTIDPGLPSRFGGKIEFESYKGDALSEIQMNAIPEAGLRLGGPAVVSAMEEAMDLVAATPDNASVRDAQRITTDANTARRRRVAGKGLSEEKQVTLAVSDWRKAMAKWSREHNLT